jgi:hypothetical protein
MAEAVTSTTSSYDLQSTDALKQVQALTSMLQHAGTGADLSQHFPVISPPIHKSHSPKANRDFKHFI